ncbi:UNVERIFIED_CONTAM: hypothetical protein Sradi_5247400 [Sesamum radiatum]|uniref:Uncharacterized protein n=1 Tax=Sesamum radiatum TaxID=300843 RepID=A0AAW2LL17_SESRA
MFQTPSPILLSPRRKILLKTQVEAEVRRPPPQQQLIPQRGGVPSEGMSEGKKENTPTDPPEGPSHDPPAPAAVPKGTPPLPQEPRRPRM